MKISYNWLREYVDVTAPPEELAEMLTMAGLEVETIESIGGVPDGVVVGHVISVDKHPKADRLTVCSVDAGGGEPLQVICGAPNVAAGQRVPVATPGTRLSMPDGAGGSKDLTVDRAAIRGVESAGMICAEDELGLSEDHSGIMVLEADAPVGQPFGEYLETRTGLRRDFVIDIAVTPNRPDATSHVGVARDVSALTDQPLRLPDVDVTVDPGEASRHIDVSIVSPELCHRYVGVVVRDVKIDESPAWLKQRLEAIGLRPRNNVVDITNFVMHEIGQPLHAFDLDELTDAAIVVGATEGPTKFTTLDDRERELPTGTLMIRDGARDVAIAGVMGGQNSEVSDKTVNVLIESAYFDPSSIRRTAKALGLQTDASYRFERGVDPDAQAWAAMRAAQMMVDVAGGTIVGGPVDAHPMPHERLSIEVRTSRADDLLGTHVPRQETIRQLRAIGIEVVEEEGGRLTCTIPPHRPDIEREVDVIEEIARLHGYDRIEEPPHSRIPGFVPRTRNEDAARENLFSRVTGWGFREVFTNSLLSEDVARRFRDEAVMGDLYRGSVVTTANAITQEMSTLRPSLLPGLLQVAQHNVNHGRTDIRLVETGHVFTRDEQAATLIPGYEEHEALSFLLTGRDADRHWATEPRSFDFHDISGVVDSVFELLRVEGVAREVRAEATDIVEVGVAYVLSGEFVGFASQLAGGVASEYDLEGPVLFAEMNWTRLLQKVPPIAERAYREISRFPTVERDLAFVVSQNQAAGPMLDTIRGAGGSLLADAGVFDVYEADRVGPGKKSVAFYLRFVADRTLTDDEVDAAVRKVVAEVTRSFDADLRE